MSEFIGNDVNLSNLIDSPNIVCECGCKTFIPAVVLKSVSKLVSPTGKDEILDLPVYICSKCGKVPDYYKNSPNYARIFGELKQ